MTENPDAFANLKIRELSHGESIRNFLSVEENRMLVRNILIWRFSEIPTTVTSATTPVTDDPLVLSTLKWAGIRVIETMEREIRQIDDLLSSSRISPANRKKLEAYRLALINAATEFSRQSSTPFEPLREEQLLKKEIIQSGYMGMLVEIGAGTEIARSVFSDGGTSRYISSTASLYNQADRDRFLEQATNYPSVSSDMALALAKKAMGNAAKTKKDGAVFGLALTGATQTDRTRKGQDHFYLALCGTGKPDVIIHGVYQNQERQNQQIATGRFGLASLHQFLTREPFSIENIKAATSRLISIDHIEVLEKALNLSGQAEVLSLPEISTTIVSKGEATLENMAHRISMFNLLGYPVLVTNQTRFFSLAELLRTKSQGKLTFLCGMDTLVRIMEPAYYADLHGKAFEAIERLFKDNTSLWVADRFDKTRGWCTVRQFLNSAESGPLRGYVTGSIKRLKVRVASASSEEREKIGRGEEPSHISATVREYIKTHSLYS